MTTAKSPWAGVNWTENTETDDAPAKKAAPKRGSRKSTEIVEPDPETENTETDDAGGEPA